MTAIRLLDTGLQPARRNVAMTAALVELHRSARIPDTLRFHRYPRSVLLGRSQAAEQAVNLAWCEAQGIEIARRITGGGAVYMSPCVLAWDIVASRKRFGSSPGEVGSRLCYSVAQGLSRLGAPVRHRPPNDLAIGARKLGGASGIVDGSTLLYQGTVLVEMELSDMAAALTPACEDSRSMLGSLRQHVTSLADHIAPPPMAQIADAIRAGLEAFAGCAFEAGALSEADMALTARLEAAEIGADAFAFLGEAA